MILIIDQLQDKTRQDKTRQREVTDAGTTVPLSPHLKCRYSDKQYSLYLTKNSDRSPVPVRLALQSNLVDWTKTCLNVFKYFHGINIYNKVRQTIPSVYYSWSEEIFANIVMETLIKQFIFVASGDCIGVELKTGKTVDSYLFVTIL